MAELATIARPYAEALFEAAGDAAATLTAEVKALADVAADPGLRQFAENPKVSAGEVFELITSVARREVDAPLSAAAQNFLRTVIDNGRLAVLPTIARQFRELVNRSAGISDATVYSAFEMTPEQLGEITATLEKRFGCKLKIQVVVEPELIGGIRVVVGDEVLDTSVKARLQQMKVALTA
jgi:F-type H+-transporting ATPase subunit delta